MKIHNQSHNTSSDRFLFWQDKKVCFQWDEQRHKSEQSVCHQVRGMGNLPTALISPIQHERSTTL